MAEQNLSVLIIEDERPWAQFLDEYLSGLGYECRTAHTGEDAYRIFDAHSPTVVLVDWRLPDVDGMEVIRELRSRSEDAILIMMTGHGTSESAMQAYKSGASDYLTKPFNANQVHLTINRVLEARRLQQENERLRNLVEGRMCFGDLVGSAPAMQAMYGQMEEIAKRDTSVLIVGESGSGRTVAAQAIHMASGRPRDDFVLMDIASLEPSDVDRLLFGTGSGEIGALQRAGRGSVCLANIDSLPPGCQQRLITTLREQAISPIAGNGTVPLEARMLSTVRDDVSRIVESGVLDRDLVNLLGVVRLHVPPLRDRREDIPLLLSFFLERSNRRHGRDAERLAFEAMLALFSHLWPGNVAELESLIDLVVAESDSKRVIGLSDLPDDLQRSVNTDGAVTSADVPLREAKRRFEREYFVDLLRRTKGNMSLASRASRVGRPYLYKKISDHEIDPNEFR